MVWFQCEDCGENLKKPKLPGHFRMCSAHKLSCIDCGYMFTQQSVQGHTQCMTEAEKYGPKGQAKHANGTPAKPKVGSKPTADVDISVGLSTRPPWTCSLCNTNTTSEQTLLLHAEGRKHRAKARAFHASKNPPSSKPEYSALNETGSMKDHLNGDMVNEKDATKVRTNEDIKKQENLEKSEEAKGNGLSSESASLSSAKAPKETVSQKKRKLNASETDMSNGELIQAEKEVVPSDILLKKKKCSNATIEEGETEQKIKWKKLIASVLKSTPDGVLKIKKLEKLVLKALQESGAVHDGAPVRDTLVKKIEYSSKFVMDKKLVRLASKGLP